MTKKLDLSMFARNANKPKNKEVENLELLEINNSINRGKNEFFKKYGTKNKIVECIFINKQNKEFIVYYFIEVYELIKHIKQIKFVKYRNAITTQNDIKTHWIELAKKEKKVLKNNLDLCIDKIIFLN